MHGQQNIKCSTTYYLVIRPYIYPNLLYVNNGLLINLIHPSFSIYVCTSAALRRALSELGGPPLSWLATPALELYTREHPTLLYDTLPQP